MSSNKLSIVKKLNEHNISKYDFAASVAGGKNSATMALYVSQEATIRVATGTDSVTVTLYVL